MSMHEYEWRMNEEELKDGWVCMNMYGRWMKINERMDELSIHEYKWSLNEEELKDGWVCMNMYGGWMKKN